MAKKAVPKPSPPLVTTIPMTKARRVHSFSLAGIAKEIEGLGLTIEHLLNRIGSHEPTFAEKGMLKKIQWLWSDISAVVHGLGTNSQWTHTDKSDLKTQMAGIARVASGSPYAEIVQDLLKTILIRNQGTHLSLRGFGYEELFHLLQVLLRSTILIWRHAKTRGLI